ncbi:MAG: DUF1538 domain-containing protein [Treponema sp.]|jgi:hypothetical protein|nr:DUF1538 domain-containing protein [Treponema sp.]
MNKILSEKIKEAFSSVLPITGIVLAISVIFTPIPAGNVLMFLAGAVLLVLGMGFFSLGAEMSMIPMGEGIGVQLTKSSKLALIIIVSFVMGVIITVAEPDLIVLAEQVAKSIRFWDLIFTVAAGVGLLLVISVLRTLLKIRLSVLFIIIYGISFLLAILLIKYKGNSFIPIAFESGAVATGPIVVPFILAIGVGLASIRSDKDSHDDSFGLVALVLSGPVLAMLVLGFFYETSGIEIGIAPIDPAVAAANSRQIFGFFAGELPKQLLDVSLAMGSILVCFLVFQIVTRRFHKHQLGRILIGFLYTLLGLVFFLTGVNVGFIPVGQLIGSALASSEFNWILIPLGAIIGYYIVAAEPAVYVLNKQVEEISSGAITAKMMNRGLAIGIASALALTMTRILFGIPLLWILIPGYIIALVLTFFVPKIFTAIAFDSGAVCTGPMSATFLLPLVMGVAEGIGRNLMHYAIGIVAIVAMTPAIVIQVMGLVYQIKINKAVILAEQHDIILSAATAGKAIDWGAITVYSEGK